MTDGLTLSFHGQKKLH